MSVSSSASYNSIYVAAFNSAGVCIDRETIAIVKDGAKGLLDEDKLNEIEGDIDDIQSDMGDVQTKVGNIANYDTNGRVTSLKQYMATAVENTIAGTYSKYNDNDGDPYTLSTLFSKVNSNTAFVETESGKDYAETSMVSKIVDEEGNIKAAEIVAAVNADDSSVKISANKITLTGETVVNAINGGNTTINGNKIKTGSITADQIDSTNLHINADNINLNGHVWADTLTADQIIGKMNDDQTRTLTLDADAVNIAGVTITASQVSDFASSAKGAITAAYVNTLELNSTKGKVGGWSIGANQLSAGSGTSYVGLNSATSGDNSAYAIWAGNGTPASAPFSVTKAGKLTAAGAVISGNITATSGTIGGLTLSDSSISSSNSKFSVTSAGKLTATDAVITGAITATSLSLGSNKISTDNIQGLSTVATTGLYSDITGKPTKLSDFTNDSKFITNTALSGYATTQNVSDAVANCLTQDDLTGYVQSSDLDGYVETNVGLGDASSGSYFLISNEGLLTANNAIITGQVSATSGAIGGILIGNNNIASTNGNFSVTDGGVLTAKSGTIGGWTIGANQLSAGSGTSYIALNSATSGNNSSYAIWAGNSTPTSASFSVTKAGVLNATSAKISGEITATKLTISSNATVSGFIPQSVVSGLTSDLSTINGNITSVGDKADTAIADAATAKSTATNAATAASNAATAASNASTAASNAQNSANSAASVVQTIYHAIANSATTGPSSPGSTWITDATGENAKWTTLRPAYNASYKRLYVATQKKTVGGTVTTTSPVLDQTTTVIDGGNITTGTIAAARIDTDNLVAKKLAATQGTVGGWTINGDSLDSYGGGSLHITPSSSSDKFFHLDNNGLNFTKQTDANTFVRTIELKMDGSGRLASGNLSWTAAGALTATNIAVNGGNIGIWTVDSNKNLVASTTYGRIQLASSGVVLNSPD